MLRISIDGACRRNGKPDCISAGGVFILHVNDEGKPTSCETVSTVEFESTNQRGELNALIAALEYIRKNRANVAQIVTDSEYLFNAMTKAWYQRWAFSDWKLADGGPVKNQDLWKKVSRLADVMTEDVTFYHIKGHVMSFGKITATRLLNADESGKLLYREMYNKYQTMCADESLSKNFASNLEYAQELSGKNNGFSLPEHTLRNFVVINSMADAIATRAVENADA